MATKADAQQGQLLPPSNVPSTERFPDFLFTRDSATGSVQDDDDRRDHNVQHWALLSPASSSSSRSSTLSSVSTAASSLHGCHCSIEKSHPKGASSPRPRSNCSTPSPASPGASPTSRNRRDKHHLHAARQQRSGSNGFSSSLKLKQRLSKKQARFGRSSCSPADALAAVEPPHDQGLTRMAFAEQQRWITVQQKTFTKWYEQHEYPKSFFPTTAA